jgi:sigma-E factor negative regulatory protein RseC
MIRHLGTVLRVDGDLAWVECERGAPCAMCPGRGACESAALSGAASRHRLRARCDMHRPAPGSEVVVGIPAGALLRAALIAYAVPLASLLAGAGLGSMAGTAASAAGAALGLAAGVVLAGRAGRGDPVQAPRILDIVES